MARGAAKQKSKQPPPTVARRPGPRANNGPKIKHNMSVEDTMFFPRLRNHAKWMFVFLAVVFMFSFVFLGVGSGSTGLGDLLDPTQWFSSSTSSTSLSSLKKKAEKNPTVAQDQIDYAQALDAKGKTQQALLVLQAYSRLKPKDSDVLTDLAGRYETQAQNQFQIAQNAQISAASVDGSSLFPQLKLGKKGDQTIGTDPVVSAVTSKAQDAYSKAQTAAQVALTNDVGVLKKVVAITPDDTISIIRLANAASQIGDSKTAITQYKRFLKLAPDDPQAALAKSQLKQLQASAVTPGSGG